MKDATIKPHKTHGRFVFRTSAILLIASALLEIFSITDEVPLFNELRGGVAAGIYHLAYVALFLALGIGIWGAKKWGYVLVFVTTVIYTLDSLQYILSQQAIAGYIKTQISGYESVFESLGFNADQLTQLFVLTSLLVSLCWWGFALYTYLRRDYFKNTGA
jgi:multisubunit Na+/H+ antiporter MnhC subunit